MSADYETAIRFGATHVRVGSAIFGARAAGRASCIVCAGTTQRAALPLSATAR